MVGIKSAVFISLTLVYRIGGHVRGQISRRQCNRLEDMSVDRYLGKGHVRGQISRQRTCPWTDIVAKDMSVDRYLGKGHVRGQISRQRTCPWTDISAEDMSVDRYLGGGHVRGQISWQRTCPWTDISAAVQAIVVKFCNAVHMCPRQVLSHFGAVPPSASNQKFWAS